ncbi:MAG: FG-GAP repeat domain-containing protein [Candidatus Polarisedimenticolia bacterium]
MRRIAPFRYSLALLGRCLCLVAGAGPAFAGTPALPARHVVLDLPGPPASIVPADLNDDGEMDLAVVVLYSEYEELEFEKAQGFVQFTEIVPALFERRQLRGWLRQPDGSYTPAGPPMEMPTSLLSIEAGTGGTPLIALTDDGVARLRLSGPAGSAVFVMEPVITAAPALRGAGSFIPGLDLLRDMDGKAGEELLMPGLGGLTVHTATPAGFSPATAEPLSLPNDLRGTGSNGDGQWRRYPMPRVEDVDGDRVPDLLVLDRPGGEEASARRVLVLRGTGGGRYEAPRTIDVRCPDPLDQGGELAYAGDLDGDGRAELVFRSDKEDEDDGLDEAREPKGTYRFHHLGSDLTPQRSPYAKLDVVGHGFGGGWPHFSGNEFRDLDGDGRRDLLTLTLDFSFMQIMRVITTKKFGMKMHFQPWVQGPDGTFTKVPGQDLSAKFLVDFDNFRMSRLPLFAGDFDGDHAVDFVEMTGGRVVRIRRGHRGCSYSPGADWELKLEEEPQDPGLLRVADLDGDGLSDMAQTRALDVETDGATAPVKLDLYLSRGAR